MNEANQAIVADLLVAADFAEETGGIFSVQLIREFAQGIKALGQKSFAPIGFIKFPFHDSVRQIESDRSSQGSLTKVTHEVKRMAKLMRGNSFFLASSMLDTHAENLQRMKSDPISVLLNEQSISYWEALHAFTMQKKKHGYCFTPTQNAVKLDYVDDVTVAKATAKFYRLGYRDIDDSQIPESLLELIPEAIAREMFILPIHKSDRSLWITCSNPHRGTVEKLQFILNRKISIRFVATESQILNTINRLYGGFPGETISGALIDSNFEPAQQKERTEIAEHTMRQVESFRSLWRAVGEEQ